MANARDELDGVDVRLEVEDHHIRLWGEQLQELLGRLHHQVALAHPIGSRRELAEDLDTQRQVRHEAAIAEVEVCPMYASAP
jgi:hypothetical protein